MSSSKCLLRGMVVMLFCAVGIQGLFGQLGGGGGQEKKTWGITSPAETDPLAELPNDASVACSGDAEDNSVAWECIIQSSLQGQYNNVAGTSANNAWSGTVPKLPQNWYPGNATATLKVMDETVDTNNFKFKN